MSEPYDLRSNLKNKPGAQGTLFQVKDKGLLNPAQRWPRGYGPERQAEVQDVLKKTPVSPPSGVHEQENRARIVDTISRSTIPVRQDIRSKDAHLGLNKIHGVPQEGSEATYWPKTRALAVDMRMPRGERNLIHELGHHADNIHDDTKAHVVGRVMAGDTDAVGQVRGVMEGVADNYMEKHYRSRGRNPQPVAGGRYEETFSASERDEKYPGYNNVRPPQPSASFHALQETQFNPALFSKGEASGQQSPLARRLAARADANRHAIGVPWEGNK